MTEVTIQRKTLNNIHFYSSDSVTAAGDTRKNDFIVGAPPKQAAQSANLKVALNLIFIPLDYNGVPECYLNGDRYCVLGGLKLISPSSSIRFSGGCFLLYLIAICWLHHPAVFTFFL